MKSSKCPHGTRSGGSRRSVAAWAVVVMALASASTCAWAQSVAKGSQALSNAAGLSAFGSGLIIQGSLKGVQTTGELVVESIKASGEFSVVVLRSVSDGARVSIQFAAGAAGAASLAVGSTVVVVADATGYSLMQGAKLLSYIANEVGAGMVHQSRHGEVRR